MKQNIDSFIMRIALIGFGLLVGLFILIGGFSWLQINSMRKVTSTIYNHPLKVSNAALKASLSIARMHRSMKDVVFSEDPEQLEQEIGHVKNEEEIVIQNLDTIQKLILGIEGQVLEEKTRKLFTDWKPIRDEVISHVKSGDFTTAARITKMKGADHELLLQQKMSDLAKYANRKADIFMSDTVALQQKTSLVTNIIVCIGVLLSAIIAFITMRLMKNAISQQKQVEEALQESEEKYRKLFEVSGNGVFIYNPETMIILDANQAMEEIYGYSHDELIGMNCLNLSAEVENSKNADQKAKEEGRYKVNLRWHKKKDGTVFPIEIDVYTIELKGTRVGFSIVNDITERKQAEDQIKASLKEKQTLIDEIHHRVKNNMQIIASLLSLQISREDDERIKSILNENRGRVFAISAIHESLVMSENLSEINLKSYLTKLVQSLLRNYSIDPGRINYNIEIPDIKVNIDTANPLNLVLNELISNSLKYAFPDERKGEINIKLKIIDDQAAELTIKDDGIGMPEDFDWKISKSLGLKLVRTLVENQLDGSIDMESKHGTKFTIRFNFESNYK